MKARPSRPLRLPRTLETIQTTEVYNYTLVPPFGRTEKRRLRAVPKIASA